jgi:enamine deaminase RidA (YjgF/YER057c/UK114 family)
MSAVDASGAVSPEARLAELGIELPDVVPPVATYVPAVVGGSFLYTSGQLPMVSGALPATGKVGDGHGLVPADDAKAYARICALNALAAARSVLGSLDRVTQVVKVTGFVASDPSFTGQPGVVNGASEVLGEIFGEAGRHARSAVGVAVLPLDSPVEVELILEFA